MAKLLRPKPVPAGVSVAAAVVSTGAGAYLTVAGLFDEARSAPWLVVSIVVAAVVSVVGTVRAALFGTRRAAALKTEEAVREHLQNALFSAHDLTGIDVRQWNSVFMAVAGRGRFTRLVAAVRAGFGPHENSNVRWTRGKGTVGAAWETEQVVFDNIRPIFERHGTCTEPEWDALPDNTRKGLTYRDWVVTRGKYGTIIAACTRDSSDNVTGVIAINAPVDHNLQVHEKDLKDLTVTTALYVQPLVD